MNRKVLQKIIDELKSDKPDLSYIRGILEMMIETFPEENKPVVPFSAQPFAPVQPGLIYTNPTITPVNGMDESAQMERIAASQLAKVLSQSNIEEIR